MRFFVLFAIALSIAVLAHAQDLEVQQPKGNWQQPKEFQVPKGQWQEPGDIQVPKGIQAVRTSKEGCEERLSVVADALFDFDKSSLRPDAEETLVAAGPEIAKLGGKPSLIEGHTDAVGTDAYNQKLSEARAAAVRDWLEDKGFIPPATPIQGGRSRRTRRQTARTIRPGARRTAASRWCSAGAERP